MKTWKSHVFHDFSISKTSQKPLLKQCPNSSAWHPVVHTLTDDHRMRDIHAELRQPRWLERDLENPDHTEFHSVSSKPRDRKCFSSPSLLAPTLFADLDQIYHISTARRGSEARWNLKTVRQNKSPPPFKIKFSNERGLDGSLNISDKTRQFPYTFLSRK